jgi:ribosomal protein S27AE
MSDVVGAGPRFAPRHWEWQNALSLSVKTYECGWCGKSIATKDGYFDKSLTREIRICPGCGMPTVFSEHGQTPGSAPGRSVEKLKPHVQATYEEARRCAANACFTACAMLSRKLLMNIAVEKGADPGLKYAAYVQFLVDNHHVSASAEGWVDRIRNVGNTANHELPQVSKDDGLALLRFVEMLLITLFEFPALVP